MRARTYTPTAAELHRRWLELVDTDGPFLAVPPLKRVWPQGMPALHLDAKAVLVEAKPAFEKAWEAWDRNRDDDAALPPYRAAREAWVATILRDVVGWGDRFTTDLASTPAAGLRATSLDRTVSVTPTGALVHNGTIRALLLSVDPVDSLNDAGGDGWAASPVDRMEALLQVASVPIGVVTDGRWWALVCAQDGAMTASGIVDSQTWIEEPDVRDAFIALLSRTRLIGGKPEDRLPALFTESVAAAEEITEALGVQVRAAVELLVSAFSETAEDTRRHGEPDPLPADRDLVYQAAVTVMMRVVFLLFAEERSLLPQGELFTMGYGITGQLDELDERKRLEGAESLDATHLTWHRLLATSQALYAGATFEDMRLPAYGGSLFDPARFPFLLARREQGNLRVTVSDRVMLEVLRSVQQARIGQEARRISFRDIDVEQIGYIYEGLLGYSCTDVNEIHVGLVGADGAEPEIPLDVLNDIAARHDTDAKIAYAILAWVKEHQPAAKPRTKAALTKALANGDTVEDADLALLAVTRDPALRKELRSWIGIIRRDLRGRPVVIQPGGLLVIETPSRATSGAHYTPRSLAEHIVEHAIEPLVYRPGPHQTADRTQWRLISSDDLLDLNVADIACGSGAFLVAAARYLAKRLVEAWHHEGVAHGGAHDLEVRAIRQVVASCLYGADINEMAVEMCKLSLWLVSLDPKLPFSFVDDKILCGNSLLGLTSARQLEAMHIDPEKAPRATSLFDLDVEDVLRRAVRLRERLATEVDDADPQRSATTKRRQWDDYQKLTAQLRTVADGVIAAGLKLGGKPGKPLDNAYHHLRMAVADAYPTHGGQPKPERLEQIIAEGLTPTIPTDYDRWQPVHWILAVPDVMQNGGFDAIIGNPPFLGGTRISGALGVNVRDWLAAAIANVTAGAGRADLVSYFFLRAHNLLANRGTLGLIATNTIAQGDSREVGLDGMVQRGFTITRAIQSRSWPAASANLEYAAVWGTATVVDPSAHFVCDDAIVRRITTLLEAGGRVERHPSRLGENLGVTFEGCKPYGMGFVVEAAQVSNWFEADPRNANVLFPYLNGDDLNSRPDCSPSRWVIDFLDREEVEARTFPLPFAHLESSVKQERFKKSKAVSSAPWWLFFRVRLAMRRAIAGLGEVLVIARVSKTVMPLRVPTGQVPSEATVVFATDSYSDQAVLSSSAHQMWAITYGSTLETRVRYTPSDVFETFPRPESTDSLDRIGRSLDAERREIMLRRNVGLTKLYNLVNDPEIQGDADVDRLRVIHVELDEAVMDAYGWSDIQLKHGFHTYRQMERWTVCPEARMEILDRLLEENHRRAALQGDVVPSADDDEDVENE